MNENGVHNPPDVSCDMCDIPYLLVYIDGKTTRGPWANMCMKCFQIWGVGIGTGKGQKYKYDKGRYKKVNR